MTSALRRCLAAGTVLAAWFGGAVAYAPAAIAGPVTGSVDRRNPTELPPGDSTDRLGNGQDEVDKYRYYKVQRRLADSTLFFGAAMSGPNLGYGGFDAKVTQNDRTCYSKYVTSARRGKGVISTAGDVSSSCRNDSSAVVRLERADLPGMTRVTEPVDMLMRVTEVPVPKNLSELPASLPEARPEPIRPTNVTNGKGGPLTRPQAIESGQSIRTKVPSIGQPMVFAVDVDWGQWLQVQTDIASSPALVQSKALQPQLGVTVLNPALDSVGDTTISLTGDPAYDTAEVVTRPVVYKSYDAKQQSSYLAGRHLVAVWVSPDGLPAAPLLVDVTLSVRVGGEITGRPDFGKQPAMASSPTRPWSIGFGTVGVGLLLAAGAVWLVSRRQTA